MPRLILETYIDADKQKVFDLARNIDLHQVSIKQTSPLGMFGRIADSLFLSSYLTDLLVKRNTVIKSYAESN